MGECLIIRGGGGTDTSNANATAGKVLSGYTCYVNDSKITGTMPNQGTKTASLNPGGSYTIQAGYHNGSGKISVNSLSSQTSATANAGRILSGRTAWVGGSKLTGTMTNRGAVSKALGANGSYTIPAGWHNGSGKVTQNLTKQAAVNVTPGTANKTACAANRWTTGNIVIVGSSALTAGNIKNGVTIFGVKGTFTGWVDSVVTIWSGNSIYHETNTTSSSGTDFDTWTIQNHGYFEGIYVDARWERYHTNSSGIVVKGQYKTDSQSYWSRSTISENYTGTLTDYRITRTHNCHNDDTVTIGFNLQWCKLWVTKIVGKKEWS